MDADNAVERTYELVRTRILSGQYSARQHLRESTLAAEVGVSRTPVREALQRLAAEQLVVFIPNRGAFVAERPTQAAQDAVEIRAMLEGYAAQLAAAKIGAAELQRLEALAARIEQVRAAPASAAGNDAASLSLEFHLALCRAARSETLMSLLRLLLSQPLVATSYARYTASDWDLARGCRQELVRALKHGDARFAASLASSLVLQGGRTLREEESMPARRGSVTMLFP